METSKNDHTLVMREGIGYTTYKTRHGLGRAESAHFLKGFNNFLEGARTETQAQRDKTKGRDRLRGIEGGYIRGIFNIFRESRFLWYLMVPWGEVS